MLLQAVDKQFYSKQIKMQGQTARLAELWQTAGVTPVEQKMEEKCSV
jgi:hypothetical protein